MRKLPLLLIPFTLALAAIPFSPSRQDHPPVEAQVQPWTQPETAYTHPGAIERQTPVASSTLEEVYEKSTAGTVRVNIGRAGLGTGFFITRDGYVMTAAHVALGDTSEPLTVLTTDGKEYPATLVGYDELKDLAILKVKGNNFPILKFSASLPKVGDGVVAIGNSRGALQGGRAGKVTGLGASLSPSFPSDMVSSSMPLAPGDSGGPVLNDKGEVVGVSTAISSGMGQFSSYFVPLTTSSKIVQELKAGLKNAVPIIGVSIADARDYLDTDGALVTEVVPGLGAQKAGIKDPEIKEYRDDSGRVRQEFGTADVIVAVEGKTVRGSDDLIAVLRSKKAGDQVTLKVKRGKDTVTLKVTLSRRHNV